jgi:ferredoxin-type protein NapH
MAVKKLLLARRATQVGVGFLLYNCYFKVVNTKVIYDGPLKAGCVPGLNCHACPLAISSCPIGGLQYFAAAHQFPIYLAGFLALLGIIGGRFVCGWLCWFGLLQDWMYKIRSVKFKIPPLLHHFRWVSLVILSIALPWFTGKHWFSALCPNGAIIGAIPWAIWNPTDPVLNEPYISPGSFDFDFWLKIVILAGFLVWFVVAKRPFCRTSCPLGLIYGWFNRISLVSLEVVDTCVDCAGCTSICPVDLEVRTKINSQQCIKCLDCVSCKFVRYRWNWGLFTYHNPAFKRFRKDRIQVQPD